MSIQTLIETFDETRRLAIAGSAVAPGDFRLKKLIPPLQKSGEKAPIFSKVAQAVQTLVDSTEKTAAQPLLDLATLTTAILYTQGETGLQGELKPLATSPLALSATALPTQASARTLKPLLEALSSTGSGRLELIKDAHDRNAFRDLRLVKPALSALDDPYPEIADFIAEKVLPLYGQAILPELRATLDLKSHASGHAHRLALLHTLNPAGSRDLIQSALTDGSKELKVIAIESLDPGSPEDLTYLLDQSKAKAKDVKAAALRALASAGTSSAQATDTLKKAIAGDDLELLISSLKDTALPEIHTFILQQSQDTLTGLLSEKDKAAQGKLVLRLQQLIASLEDRKDPKTEAFLLSVFDLAPKLAVIKSEPSGSDVNEAVAHTLARGTQTMQKRLVAAHKDLSPASLAPALFAARATMTPAAFFDEFNPLLKAATDKRTKKNADDHDRAQALRAVLLATEKENGSFAYLRPWLTGGPVSAYYRHLRAHRLTAQRAKLAPLDPRWLDAAVSAEALDLVTHLARPGHQPAEAFLAAQLAATKDHQATEILRTMVRIGHPHALTAITTALKQIAKDPTRYYFHYHYAPLIAALPKSALPTLEALLPTLPEKLQDHLLDPLHTLKSKPE